MRQLILVTGIILVTTTGIITFKTNAAETPKPPNDSKLLADALALPDSLQQAQALLDLLQKTKDQSVHRYAYSALVRVYGKMLASGAKKNPAIEEQIINKQEPAREMLMACYGLIEIPNAHKLLENCLKAVSPDIDDPAINAERNRLAGTLAWHGGETDETIRLLSAAALLIDIEHDPKMHLKLAQAQKKANKKTEACITAQKIYSAHPLLPGTRDVLSACGSIKKTIKSITAEAKKKFLATKLKATGGPPIAVLNLEKDPLHPFDLDLTKLNKITILLFFSTWCSHCAIEVPRVAGYAKYLAANKIFASKVQVIGIRTAVERESESYEAFAAHHKIDFTVLTDSTMSVVFTQFAKAAGLPRALPTLVVLDAKGSLRFVINSGENKDLARDLDWAVRSLLH